MLTTQQFIENFNATDEESEAEFFKTFYGQEISPRISFRNQFIARGLDPETADLAAAILASDALGMPRNQSEQEFMADINDLLS